MQYTLSGTSECPRDTFIDYMFRPAHMRHWQKSLASHEYLEGTPTAVGCRARLVHKYGKRRVEMIEKIEEANLPNGMTVIYEAPRAWNRVIYRFSDTATGGTNWTMESEFRCTGMLRIISALLPGMFRRTSQKEMESLAAYIRNPMKEDQESA